MFSEIEGTSNVISIHVSADKVRLCTYDPVENCDYQMAIFTYLQIEALIGQLRLAQKEIAEAQNRPAPKD